MMATEPAARDGSHSAAPTLEQAERERRRHHVLEQRVGGDAHDALAGGDRLAEHCVAGWRRAARSKASTRLAALSPMRPAASAAGIAAKAAEARAAGAGAKQSSVVASASEDAAL